MKKLINFFVLFLLILFSSISNAQKASGNITFKTNTPQTTIQAKATSLFANGAHTYNISGNTNEAISFENYSLEATASLETFFNNHKNHLILNNGSNLLHAIVKGNNAKAILYNTKGQQIKRLDTQPFLENTTQIKASLTDLNNGVYIVKVQNNTGVNAFKILKTNLQAISKNSTNKKQFSKTKTTTANYNISWDEQTQDVAGQIITTQAGNKAITLEDITNNEITIPVTTSSYFTGDVAIEPLLNGSPKGNTTITLTNEQVPDSTYTINSSGAQAIFHNIYIADKTAPNKYKVKISSNDGTFLETTQTINMYHDDVTTNNIINGSEIVNLNEIPNEQDITFTIRDYKSLVIEPGVNIELIDKATGNVINTQVSDAQGEVIFEDVPGEGEYLTRTSKNGHYTKTVGAFITPKVDLVSEMVNFYNTTTIPIQFYSNGDQVTAEQANQYKLLAVNTELLHGRWNKYLPESGSRENVINRLNYVVKTLGFENAIKYFSTPFNEPTQEQIDNYTQYEANLPYGNDKMGSNLEYSGSDNSSVIRTNGNNPNYTFNTNVYQLGPSNSTIDHEIFQVIGFQQISQGQIISQTALDPTGPSELSESDEIIGGKMILQTAKNHFVHTINGKPAEYNYKTLNFN